ncbi:MAG: UDP-2,3-diacylglucosamine diphosphatase [Sphingomonadales bacterium]|nr:UDP-2,3-diacylglucosamine diphosphatase [Sphingomonadales bacterium]
MKRKVDLVILSDVHLGTYGSRASELVAYLKSIDPTTLVLNGDFIDIWQFSKRYFPAAHMEVLKTIASMLTNGTKVYYITGNHDEMLRKFKGFKMGGLEIQNKLLLNLPTGKAWIFHGDVFDTTMKHSKWVAKLGGKGYDLLIVLNTLMNWISEKLGRGRISLSQKVKDSVKGVVKYVNNFEETAAEIAMCSNYQYVVCGHIHQPQIKKMMGKDGGEVLYLNSGDWVENSTALEYHEEKWILYRHDRSKVVDHAEMKAQNKDALNYEQLLQEVIAGLQTN